MCLIQVLDVKGRTAADATTEKGHRQKAGRFHEVAAVLTWRRQHTRRQKITSSQSCIMLLKPFNHAKGSQLCPCNSIHPRPNASTIPPRWLASSRVSHSHCLRGSSHRVACSGRSLPTFGKAIPQATNEAVGSRLFSEALFASSDSSILGGTLLVMETSKLLARSC